MKRPKHFAVFSGLAALAIAVVAVQMLPSPESEPRSPATPLKIDAESPESPVRHEMEFSSAVESRVVELDIPDPFPGVKKDRKGTALDDDMFDPQSKAEQDWLQRNGYPTSDQINAYSTAQEAALEQAAKRGDKVAKTFLETQLLMKGDEAAEGRLLEQVALGNTYPLLNMAGYYAGSRIARDVPKAYAYTRVMEMLGDGKMGLMRDIIIPAQPDPVQKFEAESLAIAQYNAIVQRRRELLGPSAPAMDPRPMALD